MGNVYYIDDKFVPEQLAGVPVDDMAVLRGYGVFDFLRTYGGKPFRLKAHLERLERSAQILDLALPKSTGEIYDIVMEGLRKSENEESNIRIVLTGGSTADSITPAGKPRLILIISEIVPMPAQWYAEGVKIVTTPYERQIPEAKSIVYVLAVLALKKAYRKNAVEAVYIGKRGNLKEGTTSNFFAFINGKLVTPDTKNILSGITREVVLDLAMKEFEIEIRDIFKEELSGAQGAFLSSSNKEILPVVQIDEIVVGDGKPSEATRHIMRMFNEYTAKYGRGEISE